MRIVESRIYGALMTITDYILLGILWVITSIPIITVFSSASATYCVVKQWESGEAGNILKIYFKDFKRDFLLKLIYSSMLISLFIVMYMCLENIVKYNIGSIIPIIGVILAYVLTISLFFRLVSESVKVGSQTLAKIQSAIMQVVSHLGSNILVVILSTIYIGLVFLFPLFIFIFAGAFWKIIFLLLNRKF